MSRRCACRRWPIRGPPARNGSAPAALRELVVRTAEGNPFYLEELLRMLTEDGVITPLEEGWQVDAERLAAVRIPPTLAEFLQARLDSGETMWDVALAQGLTQDEVSALMTEAHNQALEAALQV